MQALCIADIHGDMEAVDRLASSLKGKDFRFLFLLGDYSRGFLDAAENLRDLTYVLESLRDFTVKAIPGNCDHKSALEVLEKNNANVHNAVVEAGDTAFVGLGGSNPTPFNTPFELSEEEIYKNLGEMVQSVKGRVRHIVLLTHFPPKDTKCDRIASGAHVGSASLRRIIEEYKPAMVVCSHIHESGGVEDEIAGTKIVNVGRISDGRAVVLTIEDEVVVSPYLD